MITQKDLEELGFNVLPNKSSITGKWYTSVKTINDNLVLKNLKFTINVCVYSSEIIIETEYKNSLNYGVFEQVFRGKCEDIEFFKKILTSVL